jgi:LacI family transcriptional regulator
MRKQRTVLMLLARYNHPFHLGISRYAGEHRWHLGASFTSTGILPHGWRGDGVLTTLNQNPHLLAFLRRLRVPVVDLLIQRPDVALPRVAGDNEAIGRIAAEHFLDRGFRSFAWYSDEFTNVERLRLKGFRDRLAPSRLSCATLIWCRQRGTRKSGEWRDHALGSGASCATCPSRSRCWPSATTTRPR